METIKDNEFERNLDEVRTHVKEAAKWHETFKRESIDISYYKEVIRSRNEYKKSVYDIKRRMKKAMTYFEGLQAKEADNPGDVRKYRGKSVTNEEIMKHLKKFEIHLQEGSSHLKEILRCFDLFEWHCKDKQTEEADRYLKKCKRLINAVRSHMNETVKHCVRYLNQDRRLLDKTGQNWKNGMY